MEYRKILLTRLAASVLCTIVLQIIPLTLYLLLTNFDVLHPVEWLRKAAVPVFSFSTWLYITPLHGLLFSLGVIWSRNHTASPTFSTSRFQILCSIFTKHAFLKCLNYMLLGITVPWFYLGLNNESLTQQCSDFPKRTCLIERNAFIVLSGSFTGLFYFLKYDLLSEKNLQFPIIQQLKFLQIRSQGLNVLKKSVKDSVIPVLYFFVLYYFNGPRFCSYWQTFYKAQIESVSLSTISGLLSASLFIHTWIISAAFHVIVGTLQIMIQIHFTEHYSFALIKQPNTNEILLSAALQEQNIQLIQYLAYYDLFNISTSKKSNRWQIFTLSQPGGHPHTWNSILGQCLQLINNFIGEIESVYKIPELEKPPEPLPRHIHVHDMTAREQQILSGLVPLSPVCRLRNLVTQQQQTVIPQSKSKLDEVQSKIKSYLAEFYKQSAINYVFGNLPDAKTRHLVSNCQPVIWATQSIAELAANALTEDQFGIVLKDLPIIITTLLQLKITSDKLGNIQKKFRKREHKICMKTALRSAAKRSLYKIAIAYCDYLNDLPLSPDILHSMQSFIQFKEC